MSGIGENYKNAVLVNICIISASQQHNVTKYKHIIVLNRPHLLHKDETRRKLRVFLLCYFVLLICIE